MTLEVLHLTEPLSHKDAGTIAEMYRARAKALGATATLDGGVLNECLTRPDIALFCAYDGRSLLGVSLLSQVRAQELLLFAYAIRMRDAKDKKFERYYHYQALLAAHNLILESPELYTNAHEFFHVTNENEKAKKRRSIGKGKIGLYKRMKKWPLETTPLRATSTDYFKIFTAVRPEHQGRGIGSSLNRETLAYIVGETQADNIFTTCPENDTIMQRLNLRFSYESLARCSPFYKDGTAAVLMGLRVEDFRRGLLHIPTRKELEALLKKA